MSYFLAPQTVQINFRHDLAISRALVGRLQSAGMSQSQDLWAERRKANRGKAAPLAARMRPRSLNDLVGQEHILGSGSLLVRMLDADRLTSLILHGPPGTGKTALAHILAHQVGGQVHAVNAAMLGVKELRQILGSSRDRVEQGLPASILFLDEIHRFSRAQQDVLLEDVEKGLIILIGATTENPGFAVNSALVSRSTVFSLKPLTEAEIITLLKRACVDERGFGHLLIQVSDAALEHWARMCDGDARRALTALEIAVLSQTASVDGQALSDTPIQIDLACAEQSIQRKAMAWDVTGDEHYNAISALIKSMRASNEDDAINWLAVMLEAGEDPLFIARRLIIFSSEDIGLADPEALSVATSAFLAAERVGMPECQISLSQAVLHLSRASKSREAAERIWEAMKRAQENRTPTVPKSLADSHSVLGRQI